jgi:hypothetical protein
MDRIRDFLLSKSLSAVEIILLAILLLFGYINDIGAVEFHPDESFWIVSSVRLDKLLAGDFESDIWTDEPVIIFEVRPLPSYFTAVGQRLGGISAQDLPPYWIWGLPDEENLARGAMPGDELIWWSRLPMAVVAAFGSSPSDIVSEASDALAKAKPVRMGPKVGRNDPCPCGSGKKYKQCCGKT